MFRPSSKRSFRSFASQFGRSGRAGEAFRFRTGLGAGGIGALIALGLACGARTSIELPERDTLEVDAGIDGLAPLGSGARTGSQTVNVKPPATGTLIVPGATTLGGTPTTRPTLLPSMRPTSTQTMVNSGATTVTARTAVTGVVTGSVSARPSGTSPTPSSSIVATSGSAIPTVLPPASATIAPTVAMPPGDLRNCREKFTASTDGCAYQLRCSQGTFENTCTTVAGGKSSCSCLGPYLSMNYELQAEASESACREGIRLCVASASPKPTAFTCGQLVPEFTNSASCQAQLTCVANYSLPGALTAVQTQVNRIYCETGVDSASYCQCSGSLPANFDYFNYTGSSLCEVGPEVCAPAALEIINPTAQTHCEDLAPTVSATGCFASTICGPQLPAAVGPGLALVEPSASNSFCEAVTSNSLQCACDQPDHAREFLMRAAPDAAACSSTRQACKGSAPVSLGGAVSCEQISFSSAAGSASAQFACFQAFDVGGTTQELGDYLWVDCTRVTGDWSCNCSTRTEQFAVAVSESNPSAVLTSALSRCVTDASVRFKSNNVNLERVELSFPAAPTASALPSAAPSN